MSTLKTFVVASILALGLAGAASAVTYRNVEGVAREGGPSLGTVPAVTNGQSFGDFSNATGNPILEVTNDLALYGAVRGIYGSASSYRDGWTFDFGTGIYDGLFNWASTGTGRSAFFDGQLVVNGVQYLLGGSGSQALAGLTGRVTFLVDPLHDHLPRIITGSRVPDEVATWNVALTRVAAPDPTASTGPAVVPLPAGIFLLLGGLGGLALLRRRGRTA